MSQLHPSSNQKKEKATWQLHVHVIAGADQHRQVVEIDVNGDTHIGNAIVMLTQKVAGDRRTRGTATNWSRHSLWWPKKKRWLTNLDQTLDNCGVTSQDIMELVSSVQMVNVMLPDLQLLQMPVDFSCKVYELTSDICSSLSISHPEELSIFRAKNWNDKHSSKPSKSTEAHDPIAPENSSISTPNSSQPDLPAIPFTKIVESSEGVAQLSISPQPKAQHLPYLPYSRKPADKIKFASGWLNSSRSLMEQDLRENDTIMLRFKYFRFHELDNQHDQVRINQVYEQLRLAVLYDDQDLTQEEAVLFAAIAAQVDVQKTLPQNDVVDDVDLDDELNKLEDELGSKTDTQLNITEEPALYAQVKIGKKKEGVLASLQKSKLYLCKYQRFQVHAYDSKIDPASVQREQPLLTYSVKACEVAQMSSGENNKYKLKLNIGSANGMDEVHLGFLSCDEYAEWYTALTLAARNKTMADSSYREEVQSMKEMLRYRNPSAAAGDENDFRSSAGGGPVDADAARRLNPELYISHRFIKKAKKELPMQILQAQSKVAGMSLVQSKRQFIEKYMSLNDHGVAYFNVTVKRANKSDKSIVGVAPDRIIQLDHKGGEVVQTYRYTNLVKWTVNWHTSQLLVDINNEEIYLCTLDCPIKTLHEYIGGYQFLRTRTSGDVELDSQLFYELTGGWENDETM
jgi:kindlin 2